MDKKFWDFPGHVWFPEGKVMRIKWEYHIHRIKDDGKIETGTPLYLMVKAMVSGLDVKPIHWNMIFGNIPLDNGDIFLYQKHHRQSDSKRER